MLVSKLVLEAPKHAETTWRASFDITSAYSTRLRLQRRTRNALIHVVPTRRSLDPWMYAPGSLLHPQEDDQLGHSERLAFGPQTATFNGFGKRGLQHLSRASVPGDVAGAGLRAGCGVGEEVP